MLLTFCTAKIEKCTRYEIAGKDACKYCSYNEIFTDKHLENNPEMNASQTKKCTKCDIIKNTFLSYSDCSTCKFNPDIQPCEKCDDI